MLSLSYGQVEALVTGMLDVDPNRTSAVTARFNAVRRMRFPDGVNLGPTGRFRYDLDATLKCLVLFALLDALLMPQQAVALLRKAWPEIAPVIRSALVQLTFEGTELVAAARPADAPFLVLEPAALAQLRTPVADGGEDGERGEYRPTTPGELHVRTAAQISERLAGVEAGRTKPGTLAIDLFDIVSWTAGATVRAGWATPQALGSRVLRRTSSILTP